jgi:nicotinamidase-related amidase
MDITRSALIVVDVQNGFARARSRHVVPAIVQLVRKWRAAGGAVVFTRYFNQPGGPFERIMGWTGMQGGDATDLVPEVATLVGNAPVLDKVTYGLDAAATALIRERAWTDLVICGLTTESCICKTAVDVFELDVTPWIVTDACASYASQEAHAAGLLVIGRFIGRKQLVTTEQVLTQLNHPEDVSP